MLHRTPPSDRPPPDWTRPKMLALLLGAAATALLLVAGLVLGISAAVHPARHGNPTSNRLGAAGTQPTPATSGGTGAVSTGTAAQAVTEARDALANQPMPQVDPDAAQPGPVSTTAPPAPVLLPAPTAGGPEQVPTGFPHTPEGAMAQLVAIDEVALQSGSLATARAVIGGWALPGGPTATSWSGVKALIALFDSAGLSGGGSPQLALVLTPLMGLVKGSVGSDFVVPCIDFELDVTLTQTARSAVADCQRMLWQPDPTVAPVGGRWMVGPGAEPANPPSVWPDTDTAIAVGYRDLRQVHR
jgi:hypothetical protein